jgi:hypothetical protein
MYKKLWLKLDDAKATIPEEYLKTAWLCSTSLEDCSSNQKD